jgi:hypothetical protein
VEKGQAAEVGPKIENSAGKVKQRFSWAAKPHTEELRRTAPGYHCARAKTGRNSPASEMTRLRHPMFPSLCPNTASMNTIRLSLAALGGVLLSVAPQALAGPKEYPMTGPIIAITDTTLVVQQAKTKETWEFARTADTKGAADLKVGDRVTVRYSMQAVSVEPKPEKPKATPAAGSASSTPAKSAAATSPAR